MSDHEMSKREEMLKNGSCNHRAETVSNQLFRRFQFFDPHDIICQCNCEIAFLCDDRETENKYNNEIEQQTEKESSGFFLLETRSGLSIVVYGSPLETSGPTHRLVGTRPCVFSTCSNVVTVKTKYDYCCDAHKCTTKGCSTPVHSFATMKCQAHDGITNITCQASQSFGGVCGKPAVKGSLCRWDHHCPGCLGPGSSNGSATVCYYCRQCWVPNCPNISTCTNECDTHCPHSCKTHHTNHCLTCHNDPCICYPVDPGANGKHILPTRFMKIRHYGLLASTGKRKKLSFCRRLTGMTSKPKATIPLTVVELMKKLTNRDISLCPVCEVGHLSRASPYSLTA